MTKAALLVVGLFFIQSRAQHLEHGDTEKESQISKPPWVIAIFRTDKSTTEFVCGSTLIGRGTVITSGTCIVNYQPSDLIVRGGEWDITNETESQNYADRKVRTIILHDEYHKGALSNDVAVLKLVEPFVIQKNINYIRLAGPNNFLEGKRCYAIGWDNDKFDQVKTFKKIDMTVVAQSTCENNLRLTNVGSKFKLHDSFLCAGGARLKSNGGLPLMCPFSSFDDIDQLVGILSWSMGCGQENVLGVYANITNLFYWIVST